MKYDAFMVLTILAVFGVLGAESAYGDTLVLGQGDALSGELVEIARRTVVFRTPLAGQLVVPIGEVSLLTTVAPRVFSFADGQVVTGRLAAKDGAIHLIASDGGADRTVDLASIVSATPVRPDHNELGADENTDAPALWQGSWEMGMHWRWGTRDYSDPFAKLTLLRQNERYQLLSSAFLEYTDEDDFPRLLRAVAQWKFRPSREVQPHLVIGVERDTDKALDLRANFAVGLGRNLLEDDRQTLEAHAGLDAAFEYYDVAPIWDDDGPSIEACLRQFQKRSVLRDLLSGGALADDLSLQKGFKRWTSFA